MARRTHKKSSAQFEKKLASYALAGAAALAVPGVAKADIINVSNIDQFFSQSSTPNSYDFNLSGASSDDITITAEPNTIPYSSDASNDVDALVNAGAGLVYDGPTTDPFSNVAALSFGSLIGTGDNFGSGGKLVAYDTVNSDVDGDWSATGASNYLGFYFTGPDGIQYGWADISTTATATTSSFEILSYAYETNPGMSISAGQTSELPEPSSLVMLALGGAGLIALRRRKRNA